jgi:VIT1/CCC1 family predicted Fe2+/Mn2+ transporter
MDEPTLKRLLRIQRMEATEAAVYRKLASRQKDKTNRDILERIAKDEKRHESIIAERTGRDVRPFALIVFWQIMLARFFGVTFTVKMMENGEKRMASEYRELGLDEIAEEEEAHEAELIELLEEEGLKYLGSIILGLSDALVELTGALAGLTFAFQSLNLVALAGLVTGIAASFSMAASEYLATKEEADGRSPIKAAGFTGIAYISTVFLLVMPYLMLQDTDPFRYGFAPHEQALGLTLAIGLAIVAAFNGYVAVARDQSFGRRFAEMAGILVVVSAISFAIGIALRGWLGVEV